MVVEEIVEKVATMEWKKRVEKTMMMMVVVVMERSHNRVVVMGNGGGDDRTGGGENDNGIMVVDTARGDYDGGERIRLSNT